MYDIGIIGGAGPMAGGELFNRIIRLCADKYNCIEDSSFPSILHVSYPFSDMLKSEQYDKVSNEIQRFVDQMSNNCRSFAIACNTLHCFLKDEPENLVHLIREAKKESAVAPYVICTQTSKKQRIHEKFISCRYLPDFYYPKLDAIIFKILAGKLEHSVTMELEDLLEPFKNETILLGCTEFSLLHSHFPINIDCIDPLRLVADKLCSNVF